MVDLHPPSAYLPDPSNANTSAYPTLGRTLVADGTAIAEPSSGGLTKRELIAAMAMQGMAASSYPEVAEVEDERRAQYAVAMADALLAELARPVAEVTP